MTTKHTPGPWCYFDDVDSPFWGEIRSIVTFDLIAQQPEADDRKADFMLMAAAPDLLEACIAALDVINELIGADYDITGEQAKCKAAIAKAKGQAE